MIIKEEYPPNIEDIKKVFPIINEHKPVFAYGDTIYNPYKIKVTPDLEHHELTHSRQQGQFPEVWWYQYLSNKEFRLEQELEAFCEQYKFAKDNGVKGKVLDWAREQMSMQLCSELYGNLISYGEAESKLRNYVKNN